MARKYITRQEVSQILEVSVETVRRNEERFGLRPVRHNARLILYRASEVQAYRQKMGMTED